MIIEIRRAVILNNDKKNPKKPKKNPKKNYNAIRNSVRQFVAIDKHQIILEIIWKKLEQFLIMFKNRVRKFIKF